jgi:hypothetical protein
VPGVDIFVAGFVCRSLSLENVYRQQFSDCIESSTGLTGSTFAGVVAYIRVHRPLIVIFENVENITRSIAGDQPQVAVVMSTLQGLGYSCSWRVLDSRFFHVPQRRRRCWMWGLLDVCSALSRVALPCGLTPPCIRLFVVNSCCCCLAQSRAARCCAPSVQLRPGGRCGGRAAHTALPDASRSCVPASKLFQAQCC